MGTRCQIGIYRKENKDIKNPDVLLYRHWDGYPESNVGVIADIKPFLDRFYSKMGDDAESCGAWLIHHLISKNLIKYKKRYTKEECEQLEFYDYSICKKFSWDIEYYYAVHPDRIDIYETIYEPNQGNHPEKWKLIRTVKLQKGVTT